MSEVITKLAFEQEYSDKSGVEHGVYYSKFPDTLSICCSSLEIDLNIDQLEFYINSLQEIKATIDRNDQLMGVNP